MPRRKTVAKGKGVKRRRTARVTENDRTAAPSQTEHDVVPPQMQIPTSNAPGPSTMSTSSVDLPNNEEYSQNINEQGTFQNFESNVNSVHEIPSISNDMGNNVSSNIRQKILKGEYIDLGCLLSNPVPIDDNSYTLIIKDGVLQSKPKASTDYFIARPQSIGPAFIHFGGNYVTRYQFNAVIKKALNVANITSDNFQSHSFRIGAASQSSKMGFSDDEIQDFGRWESKAYKRYIRIPTLKLKYRNEIVHRSLNRTRVRLNSLAATYIIKHGGAYIRYPEISEDNPDLFLDGVHLSDIGNDLFLYRLQQETDSDRGNTIDISWNFSHAGESSTDYYQTSHTRDGENSAHRHVYQHLKGNAISVEFDHKYDQVSPGTIVETQSNHEYLQLPEFSNTDMGSDNLKHDYLTVYGSVKTKQQSVRQDDSLRENSADTENKHMNRSEQNIIEFGSIRLNENTYDEIDDTVEPNLNHANQFDRETQLDGTILQTHNDPANTEIPQNLISKQKYCTWKEKCMLSVLMSGITVIIAVGTIIYMLLNKESQKGLSAEFSAKK
ncbi:unnamed protein product [Mytilus coruscus]|uniref:Uncharacterized protein n=1 Tax=Mytilus coruscus TaxID=42192 RepID=A0A6J8C880_MYTCO|nr:unnamed protein product [Mytilus coruscus]